MVEKSRAISLRTGAARAVQSAGVVSRSTLLKFRANMRGSLLRQLLTLAATVLYLRCGVCDDIDDMYVGWRAVDRFMGFRFEIAGEFDRAELIAAIVERADEEAAFGWVQRHQNTNHLVGEVRARREVGEAFVRWLRSRQHPDWRVEVLEYPDTRIHLHFSHFKILDESRITCFDDAPHKCSEEELAALAREL